MKIEEQVVSLQIGSKVKLKRADMKVFEFCTGRAFLMIHIAQSSRMVDWRLTARHASGYVHKFWSNLQFLQRCLLIEADRSFQMIPLQIVRFHRIFPFRHVHLHFPQGK
jgi:hypothetical protein